VWIRKVRRTPSCSIPSPSPFAVRTPVVDLDAVETLGHGVALWFACDDADALHDHLVRREIPIAFTPKDGPFGRYFAFAIRSATRSRHIPAELRADQMTFWIGVACADHVKAAVDGGFAQLGHGKHAPIKSLRKDDWIAYYSPTTEISGGAKVQAFTALGQVTSDDAYQFDQAKDFHPWRVNVDYRSRAESVSIGPLLEELDLTRGKSPKWGMVFRSSKVKGTDADLRRIAKAMSVQLD